MLGKKKWQSGELSKLNSSRMNVRKKRSFHLKMIRNLIVAYLTPSLKFPQRMLFGQPLLVFHSPNGLEVIPLQPLTILTGAAENSNLTWPLYLTLPSAE